LVFSINFVHLIIFFPFSSLLFPTTQNMHIFFSRLLFVCVFQNCNWTGLKEGMILWTIWNVCHAIGKDISTLIYL
jgi:hypothetical protein